MCDRLDDGSAYLRVDYSVKCWDAEDAGGLLSWAPEYVPLLLYALAMTIVYPLGTPLLFAAVLYANRKEIATAGELECDLKIKCAAKLKMAKGDDKRREEVLKENAKLMDEVEQQIRSSKFKGKGGLLRLTNGYELRCYWFECFECLRKICLVGIPVFVRSGSAAQLMMGLLVCFISFGMYASYEPYVVTSDDRLSKGML